MIENHLERTWAARFQKLLLDMKKVYDKAFFSDKDEVSYVTMSYRMVITKDNEE